MALKDCDFNSFAKLKNREYNKNMENSDKNHIHGVHHILAHSYAMQLFLFLIGVVLDLIFNLKIFNNPSFTPLGIFFLIFGTFLIIWAQKTSRNFDKNNLNKESFMHGPYRYTRSPTHYGLFLLMFGFGIMTNDLFIIIFSIISILVTKSFFLKKEEKILVQKYGTPYLEYKKIVKF